MGAPITLILPRAMGTPYSILMVLEKAGAGAAGLTAALYTPSLGLFSRSHNVF
ncbi:MAG: hypothetical protein ACRD06_06965 [Terriglobia bacterium]